MRNVRKIAAVALIVAAVACLTAMASPNDSSVRTYPDFADYLGEVKTCQYFTEDPVPDADVEIIMKAGVNAESGMNQQNWHFTAVASKDIQNEIANDMNSGMPAGMAMTKAMIADAPLVIIVSYGDGAGTEYDAGLATQAMNSAALALGYSTKIISSPTSVLNGEKQDYYRELLGIPQSMKTVGMLLVGKPQDTSDMDPDTVTGASVRNPYDEMTTYLK